LCAVPVFVVCSTGGCG